MASKTTAKKASQSTEIVLGQAAQQIAKGVSELKSASETIVGILVGIFGGHTFSHRGECICQFAIILIFSSFFGS